MRITVTILALLFCATTYAQKSERHYKESRYIKKETPHVLRMEYSYDAPNKIDDEYWGSMTIVFKDTAGALRKRNLKLGEDDKLVTCEYDYNSAWTVHGGGKLLDGTVEIIKWDKKSVTLKTNFIASSKQGIIQQRFNGTHIYKVSSKTKEKSSK